MDDKLEFDLTADSPPPPGEVFCIGSGSREQIIGPEATAQLRDRGIWMAGRSSADARFRFCRHHPPFAQIVAATAGEGLAWAQGKWRRVARGEAYISPAAMMHAYFAAQPKAVPLRGRWRVCWLWLDPSAGFALPAEPVVSTADARALKFAIAGLYRESLTAADRQAMAHWTELICIARDRILAAARDDLRLTWLWDRVDSDLASDWTIQRLADLAGLSGEQLRRLSLKQLSRSPVQQVTYLRMRRARTLLASTAFPVEVIGRQVGYDNAFAFSTAFSRTVGLSPSAYRKEHAGDAD